MCTWYPARNICTVTTGRETKTHVLNSIFDERKEKSRNHTHNTQHTAHGRQHTRHKAQHTTNVTASIHRLWRKGRQRKKVETSGNSCVSLTENLIALSVVWIISLPPNFLSPRQVHSMFCCRQKICFIQTLPRFNSMSCLSVHFFSRCERVFCSAFDCYSGKMNLSPSALFVGDLNFVLDAVHWCWWHFARDKDRERRGKRQVLSKGLLTLFTETMETKRTKMWTGEVRRAQTTWAKSHSGQLVSLVVCSVK